MSTKDKFIIRTVEEDKEYARYIVLQTIEEYSRTVITPNTYLKLFQLVEHFPAYNTRQISRWIHTGKVGRIDRNGRPLATIKEIEKFLFGKN